MIEKLNSIALMLNRLLLPLKIGCAGFLGLFFFAIFELAGIKSEVYLIPSVLGFLWSTLLIFLITTFPNIPSKQPKEAKFFLRIKVSLKRGVYHIISFIFFVLTAIIIIISFRIFKIWLANL